MNGINLIAAERLRQVTEEGHTPDRDDRYVDCALADAAACYAARAALPQGQYPTPTLWPFQADSWNPKDARSNLTRAGALCAAEIDRLDRAAGNWDPETGPEDLAVEILRELKRARAQFPGENVTFAALIEEVGELATAIFEERSSQVKVEAIQVAVMAIRIVLDGDHAYEPWRLKHGLDPLDPAARRAPQMNDGTA